MGDSITEGTIVEWTVDIGEFVEEGDVIAMVETDKVTIDIKADRAGVLMTQCGEVDANVEVGTELYVLDVDGVAGEEGAAAPAPAATATEEVPAPAAAAVADPPAVATDAKSSTRVPSIAFLGKDGWKSRRTPAAAPSPTVVIPQSTSPNAPTSVTYMEKTPLTFGRPAISEAEMESLILGGAEESPDVVSGKAGSYGATAFIGGIATAGPRGVWLAKD